MIQLSDLYKYYNRGKANEVLGLKNINLTVNEGEFVVVVGSNGSGKSTLLNIISGSLTASSGKIFINKRDVSNLREYERSRYISRIFQNPLSGTAPDLSITDNFRLAALRSSPKGLKIGVTESFKRMVKEKIALLGIGLEDKTDQLMGTLSGGQRQALTLLMSVMDKGEILLLDEPTAALDPKSAKTVMETADKLIRDNNLTAILVTHNMKEAFLYGNRIIQMNDGEIVKDLKKQQKENLQQTDIYNWFI